MKVTVESVLCLNVVSSCGCTRVKRVTVIHSMDFVGIKCEDNIGVLIELEKGYVV